MCQDASRHLLTDLARYDDTSIDFIGRIILCLEFV